MRLETKFRRLKMPVTIGSRFGEWKVCWLGRLDQASAVVPGDAGARHQTQSVNKSHCEFRLSRSLMIVKIDAISPFLNPT
jgi:hypothetical protein